MLYPIISLIFFGLGLMFRNFGFGAEGDAVTVNAFIQAACFVIFGIFLIITICNVDASTSRVVNAKTKIQEAIRNIEIAQHRFNCVTKIIASYAKEYPKEADLFKSLNLESLLILPEIKSDEFLAEQIQLALKHQNSIYSWMEKINSRKQSLDWCKSMRWLVALSFKSPDYEDYDPLDNLKEQDTTPGSVTDPA